MYHPTSKKTQYPSAKLRILRPTPWMLNLWTKATILPFSTRLPSPLVTSKRLWIPTNHRQNVLWSWQVWPLKICMRQYRRGGPDSEPWKNNPVDSDQKMFFSWTKIKENKIKYWTTDRTLDDIHFSAKTNQNPYNAQYRHTEELQMPSIFYLTREGVKRVQKNHHQIHFCNKAQSKHQWWNELLEN